ncbi:GNAT family N-acetyltransferase [Streptomyces sp. NPDC059743]|uniref:GNAT family N-acetyltransferase n=1 Tax=Streptomyces sp. NPDC059743 TaxID=3346928 RepID=UPI00364BC0BF
MNHARRAVPEDAEELVRLRQIMFDSLHRPDTGTGWQPAAVEVLRTRLAEPDATLAAFVVDRPGRPGELAACATGTVEYRLGGPGNPTGVSGHVFNVATDPDMRRRGHSRACLEALLGWYRARGVRKIDLHASREGAPLYASLGFVRTPDPSMRLTF